MLKDLITDQRSINQNPHRSHEKDVQNHYKELSITEIQTIDSIVDYQEKTTCPHPLILHSPQGYYCIEGHDLIKLAKTEGHKIIRCHIEEVSEVSEIELAIRKTAIRMVPAGGISSYAENVRNIRTLFDMLAALSDNPLIYSHGGNRRGAEFSENAGDNIRELIAERLGRSKTTINTYLSYSEYLTDETVAELAASKMTRTFFEKARSGKQKAIRELENSSYERNDITSQVSSIVLGMLADYQQSGTVRSQQDVSVQEIEILQHPIDFTASIVEEGASMMSMITLSAKNAIDDLQNYFQEFIDSGEPYQTYAEPLNNIVNTIAQILTELKGESDGIQEVSKWEN